MENTNIAVNEKEHSEKWYSQFESLYNQEDFKNAIVAIDKAIESTSDSKLLAEYYIKRGNSYSKIENLDMAIESFSQAIKVKPTFKYINILGNYLWLLEFSKDQKNTVELMNIVLPDIIKSYKLNKQIEVCILIIEIVNDAIIDVESEITKNPNNIDFLPILGFLNLLIDNCEEARDINEKCDSVEWYFDYNMYINNLIFNTKVDTPYIDYLYNFDFSFVMGFVNLFCPYEPQNIIAVVRKRNDDNWMNQSINRLCDIVQRLDYVEYFIESQKPRNYEFGIKIIKSIRAIITHLYQCKEEELIALNQKAKDEERNRIMSNLSHSIKNMLRSVIDPLLLIKKEIPEKAKVIDDALKGANLIREIVNAINLSYQTTLEDLTYDITHHGKDSVSLEEMVLNSLKYSIGNMFDDKYFPAFMQNYFPKRDAYQKSNSDWNEISGTNSINAIKEFVFAHMLTLKYGRSEVANYLVGNEKSSAIKLMILFQEIIFNAVKYSSYVKKSDRFIELLLTEHNGNLLFKVTNKFNSKVQPKSTGVGKLIIENYAKVLGCEPLITTESDIYSITMEFKDYWREK